MNNSFYNFILNKNHHKLRRELEWNLAEEYASCGLSPVERMADRFERLCEVEEANIFEGEDIVFIRTVSNLPAIFTDSEWEEIKSKHYIHELGFMSNLCPDYYGAISKGLLKLSETADSYGKRAIENIIKLSDKYLEKAKELGLNESKAGRFFKTQVSAKIAGDTEDNFYLKVKEILLSEGEVSDAIGRLTDKPYYESLTYEEKQRYNLSLSERYLRALERFRKECAFNLRDKNA